MENRSDNYKTDCFGEIFRLFLR